MQILACCTCASSRSGRCALYRACRAQETCSCAATPGRRTGRRQRRCWPERTAGLAWRASTSGAPCWARLLPACTACTPSPGPACTKYHQDLDSAKLSFTAAGCDEAAAHYRYGGIGHVCTYCSTGSYSCGSAGRALGQGGRSTGAQVRMLADSACRLTDLGLAVTWGLV